MVRVPLGEKRTRNGHMVRVPLGQETNEFKETDGVGASAFWSLTTVRMTKLTQVRVPWKGKTNGKWSLATVRNDEHEKLKFESR